MTRGIPDRVKDTDTRMEVGSWVAALRLTLSANGTLLYIKGSKQKPKQPGGTVSQNARSYSRKADFPYILYLLNSYGMMKPILEQSLSPYQGKVLL